MSKIQIELEPEALDRIVLDYLKEDYYFLKEFIACYPSDKDIKKDIKALKRVINSMSVPDEQI